MTDSQLPLDELQTEEPASGSRRKWLLAGGAAALIPIIAAFSLRGGDHTQYLTSPVQRGEIRDAVDATGTVNAVVTVLV